MTRKMTSRDYVKDINNTIKPSLANFKPPEQLTVTEWADKYRRLSAENSAEPGRWKTSRTPYLKEIMDAFTDPKVHHIIVAASSQVGKTECEMNMLGYAIDIDPGPIMWVMPTVDNSKDFSKRRIAPMIRDTKPLREKISKAKSRDSDNTVLKKGYPGGMLTMTGSNSPASLASVPARYIFGDERDRWSQDAGGEGDPWGLVEARTITFYNHKMVEVSTPTVKGQSNIEAAFNLGTQEYWCVQCPHCGEFIFIRFDYIKFEHTVKKIDGKKQYTVDSIMFACPECGAASTEAEIRKQPREWVSKNPDAYKKGVRSFWINAFSSPWMSWEKIVIAFLDADGDPKKLQTVYNTLFGELWEDRGTLEGEEEMLARREEYKADLPDGVLCLTCGVDTQDNRLEYEVVGYGFNGENWGIERGQIMGKPSDEDVWERLDGIIQRSYFFANGKSLRVSVTFVDSGGHYTQDVYERCNERLGNRVFAIKGQQHEGIPFTRPPSKVDIVKDGRKVGKAWLYMIGVDAGKEHIMSGLKVKEPGKRYSHFPSNFEKGYDINFFEGLLSEKMVYSSGKWKWEKLPGHNRNEALDCRNYANAAFRVLNPNLDKLNQYLKGIVQQKPQRAKKQQPRREKYEDDW